MVTNKKSTIKEYSISVVLIIFAIILSGITSGAFSIYFSWSNINDYIVAKSLPIYPKSTNVQIDSSTGFPDGIPSANITFHTQDSTDAVLHFYKTELQKLAWDVDETKPLPYYQESATKTIAGVTYKVDFGKYRSIIAEDTQLKEGRVTITHDR